MSVMRLRQLTYFYPGSHEPALDQIDLDLAAGECLGIVGESGCGKSTLARVVTRLLRPSAGVVEIAGRDWASVKSSHLAPLYRDVQLVFQDAVAALSPRRSVAQSLREVLQARDRLSSAQVAERVLALLRQVGLDAELLPRFPHQLSGGQRQRVVIARALALQPCMLVADEPVAALDVSVQAQILNLFARLSRDLGLAILFISHDLAAVASLCQRIAVIYRGRVVETAATAALLNNPAHPYTRRLLAAARDPLAGGADEAADNPGDDTHGAAPADYHGDDAIGSAGTDIVPRGCPYQRLCPLALPRCRDDRPAVHDIQPPGRQPHSVRCHLHAPDLA